MRVAALKFRLIMKNMFSTRILAVGALAAALLISLHPASLAAPRRDARAAVGQSEKTGRVVVAYVCSWNTRRLPDPTLMTHINYAFGHVSKSLDSCRVDNVPFLRRVVALKGKNPALRVMLSVGGWGSGNFSEMAADARLRKAFARDCRRAADEFGLDGIDIDWEYPTSSAAGISSSPDDTRNFTLLLRDLRRALGRDRLLTIATVADAKFVDFRSCLRYLDFVNVMAYDMANPPRHHSALFRSPIAGWKTASEAVDAHIAAGVPPEKMCLGMPLYGRGGGGNAILSRYMKTHYTGGRYEERWDSIARAPYLTDWSGRLVMGIETPRSIAAKCGYIASRGLLGGMYWEASEDDAQQDLMTTVYLSLLKDTVPAVPRKRVLIVGDDSLASPVRQAAEALGCEVSVAMAAAPDSAAAFSRYHLVCIAGGDADAWGEGARAAMQRYVDDAEGSCLILAPGRGAQQWKWFGQLVQHPEEKQARVATLRGREARGELLPRALRWLLRE